MNNKQHIWLIWYGVFLILALIIVWVTPNLLPSLLIAIVSYYFLNPFVKRFQRAGLSHQWSVNLVFFGMGVVILGLLLLIAPLLWDEANDFFRMLPQISRTFLVTVQSTLSRFEDAIGYKIPTSWLNELPPLLLKVASWLGGQIPNWIGQSAIILFLAPLLTFFFLKEAPSYFRILQLNKLAPLWQERILILTEALDAQIGGFIRARILESLIVGSLTWLGLLVIGLPFSLLLGALAGILNIIPYVGPIAAFAPSAILALTTTEPLWNLMLTTFIYGVVQAIDSFVLIPFFVGRIVNLHPLLVIISILLGAHLSGILGMIISIPIAGMIKVTLYYVTQWIDDTPLSGSLSQTKPQQ
ncbi:MAG: AI-2E family transporter [Bdellovibrionaceae bacterium]|nr:AI-2E family transporter [Pseudobdellovibrionaceae bacterium]MDW8189783.1 AI-2E family transporter [Pseudobdellovibrionaceae bacterium]